jgi:hypothetical protein
MKRELPDFVAHRERERPASLIPGLVNLGDCEVGAVEGLISSVASDRRFVGDCATNHWRRISTISHERDTRFACEPPSARACLDRPDCEMFEAAGATRNRQAEETAVECECGCPGAVALTELGQHVFDMRCDSLPARMQTVSNLRIR